MGAEDVILKLRDLIYTINTLLFHAMLVSDNSNLDFLPFVSLSISPSRLHLSSKSTFQAINSVFLIFFFKQKNIFTV